jgi:hypothetical protein
MEKYNPNSLTTFNSASTILMVRPANFGINPETISDNAFQVGVTKLDQQETNQSIPKAALEEFDRLVTKLQKVGIEVIVVSDSISPIKFDAVFPNNWFTTLPDGRLFLFPMKSPNRRLERLNPVVEGLRESGLDVMEVVDLSDRELLGEFLEGTGSMVFDHQNAVAYACKSERTNE